MERELSGGWHTHWRELLEGWRGEQRGDGVVLAMPTTDISVLGRGGGVSCCTDGEGEERGAEREHSKAQRGRAVLRVGGTEGGVDNAVPRAASPSVSLLAYHSAAR